jgi:hypothetical protein
MKIPSLQADLMAIILATFQAGELAEPLSREDLHDLEDEKMYWVLRCIYAHGIGVKMDEELEKKWFKEAVYQNSPDALYYLATIKAEDVHDQSCMKWLRRAANAGHPKSILAMATYAQGKPVLGRVRKPDAEEAAHFIGIGVDPLCICTQAIAAMEHNLPHAEYLLIKARRDNYSTDALYNKVTAKLSELYYGKEQYVQALLVAASVPYPSAEIYMAVGVALTGVQGYPGNMEEAMVHLLHAGTLGCSDGYVCMAKAIQQNLVPGTPKGVEKLFELAAEQGHPEAGFYFLQDPKCTDVAKYMDMIRNAKDKRFLVRCSVFFCKDGRMELANECKRLRSLLS